VHSRMSRCGSIPQVSACSFHQRRTFGSVGMGETGLEVKVEERDCFHLVTT
jgi:hypothetical protein